MRAFKWCTECNIPLIQRECGKYLTEKLERGKKGLRTKSHIVIDFPSRVKPVGRKEYKMYKDLFVNKINIGGKGEEETKKEREARFPRILYRSRNFLYSEMSRGLAHFKLALVNDENTNDWKLMNRKLEIDEIYNQTSIRRSQCKINGYFWEDPDYRQKLIEGNIQKLEKLEAEAIRFIKKDAKKKRGYEILASFSGGKDSAVTAHLVKKALGEISLLFSNTDIEYQETVDYVREIDEKYRSIFGKVIEAKSKNNFLALCKELGPPSRIMRWCCSTQKAAPANQYYSTLFTSTLSFDGIRREESNARAEYPREHQNTKLQRQYSAYPILNWTEIDVWLYTLWQNLPLNPLYEEGFARVGCWACPNNGLFDTFLFEKIRPEKAKKWFKHLQDFSKSISKETDHNYTEDWIYDQVWKGRRVKYHNRIIGDISYSNPNEFETMETDDSFTKHQDDFSKEKSFDNELNPCKQAEMMVISIDYPLTSDSYEFLKIFGQPKGISIGNRTLIKIEGKKFTIRYFEGSNRLQYKIFEKNKHKKQILRGRLIRQLNKSFNCIKCAACVGLCPNGAIKVINDEFVVDSTKCTHCLKCTSGELLKMGCVALHYKPDRLLIDRKVKSSTTRLAQLSVLDEEFQLLGV